MLLHYECFSRYRSLKFYRSLYNTSSKDLSNRYKSNEMKNIDFLGDFKLKI